jgi:hypothetical protein
MTPAVNDVRTGGWRKRLLAGAGALAAAVAIIGLLHTPLARPLLMRLGGCPMAGARMTPKEMDAARRIAVSGNRGARSAPEKPALGFALNSTTLAEVHAWAARERVACEEERPGFVTCKNVEPNAVGRPAREGAIDELDLGFDVHGRMVNVTALRGHLSSGAAAASARDIQTWLGGHLGPADKTNGAFDASRLAGAGAESLASVQYRFSDYFADVMAMTLPGAGPSVREHYMSADN